MKSFVSLLVLRKYEMLVLRKYEMLVLRKYEIIVKYLQVRRILSLISETAFQFTGKYRTYPPACLAALQKKEKKEER